MAGDLTEVTSRQNGKCFVSGRKRDSCRGRRKFLGATTWGLRASRPAVSLPLLLPRVKKERKRKGGHTELSASAVPSFQTQHLNSKFGSPLFTEKMFGNNSLRHLALSFLPGWNEAPSEQRLDNGFAVSMETFPFGDNAFSQLYGYFESTPFWKSSRTIHINAVFSNYKFIFG